MPSIFDNNIEELRRLNDSALPCTGVVKRRSSTRGPAGVMIPGALEVVGTEPCRLSPLVDRFITPKDEMGVMTTPQRWWVIFRHDYDVPRHDDIVTVTHDTEGWTRDMRILSSPNPFESQIMRRFICVEYYDG